MQNKLQIALSFIKGHKIISFFVLLLLVGGGYYGYSKVFAKETSPRYFLGKVEKGTLISSISGTGQVSSSNQIELKAKVSGDIVYVGFKNGQEIRSGALVAQIDAASAQKTLRNAETDLVNAKISLEKTKLQSAGNINTSLQNKETAAGSLQKSYEEGFNEVSNSFLDLPNVVSGLHDILYSLSHSAYLVDDTKLRALGGDLALDYKNASSRKFENADLKYETNLKNYKATTRSSSSVSIENLINETYETSKSLAEVIKDINNTLDYLKSQNQKLPSELATDQESLKTYTSTINGHLVSLLSVRDSIESAKNSIKNAERTLAENQATLDGKTTLDVQSAELAVQQKQNALWDAQTTLADYYIRAPFNGTLAAMVVKKGDSISGGASIATLITKQKIAEISLNEMDVAKVKVGQKATLEFDAMPDLTITGQVAEIDPLGTVSQGVVSYSVKIFFDVDDEKIKPGMSVSASIITDSKTDILLVPSSAIKSGTNGSYVEVLDGLVSTSSSEIISTDETPRQVPVNTGLSNDSQTEIISGLKEGEFIITRTITSSTKTNSSQTTSQQARAGVLGLPAGNTRSGGPTIIQR